MTGRSAIVIYSFETAPDADPAYTQRYRDTFRTFTQAAREATRAAFGQ